MPALDNPRWERFAQAIVEGLANGDRKPYSQGRAYIASGYTAKDQGKRGGSAEAAASKLLNRVKPIIDRVRELQAEATKRLQPKLDLSRERIGRRLDLASRMAEEDRNPGIIVASEAQLAKVFGIEGTPAETSADFATAKSMTEIGRRLLQSIGMQEPSDADVALAVEANDAFVAQIEAIREGAQGLTLNPDDRVRRWRDHACRRDIVACETP
jgi:hypothetical protein